jgi:hypothetical protein
MVVRAKLSALKRDHWYELIVRFALGGLATVTAGVVADIWGPTVGGLFLAFPAIFCASTLIEKHERARKKEKGLEGKSAVRMLPAGRSWRRAWKRWARRLSRRCLAPRRR